MSKPKADPSSGISSVDVLILTEQHPACGQRKARPGCCTECDMWTGVTRDTKPIAEQPVMARLIRETGCDEPARLCRAQFML
jgi:hypothetical protein